MQIELIQPISGENTASELLRQQGMGVHHLGIQVEDFDRVRSEMIEQGFMPVESGIAGQGTRFAMFDTRASIGCYIELVYLDEANRELFERVRLGDF